MSSLVLRRLLLYGARMPAHRPSNFMPLSLVCETPARQLSGDKGSRRAANQPVSSKAGKDDAWTDLLNSTLNFGTKPITGSSSRTSRFKSPAAQQSNREKSPFNGSDMAFNLEAMLDPLQSATPTSSNAISFAKLQDVQLRLGPNIGRTIQIEPSRGVDLGKGLAQLNMMCARNRVRADAMRQRFHERPGLKRKRLHSERWRKRFRAGFNAVVGKVTELRKKGW